MRNYLFLCRWIFLGCFLMLWLPAQSKTQEESGEESFSEPASQEESGEESFSEPASQEESSEESFDEQANQEESGEESFDEQANQEESSEESEEGFGGEGKTREILDLQGVAMTYENALKAMNTGSYFEAQVILENLLEKNPNNRDFLLLLAEVFYRQKEYNLAVESYKKVAAQNIPMDQKDLLLYVDSLLILGAKEEAIPLLNILSNKMGDVESLYKLGRIWLDFGDSQNALSAFNAAYLAAPELAPKDFEDLKRYALSLYAQKLQNRENKLNAERLKREQAKRDKERVKQFNKLKQMFVARRKGIGYKKFTPFGKITEQERNAQLFTVAVPSMTKKNKIGQEALDFFKKGNDLLQKKSFKEAAIYYQLAIDKQNDFAEAFYQKGVVLYLTKQYSGAIQAFATALEHRKYFPRALFWQANAYEKAKVLNKAMDTFIVARKMALQSGDVFVLFESFRLLKDLHRKGVRSRFNMDELPKKQIVWDNKKKVDGMKVNNNPLEKKNENRKMEKLESENIEAEKLQKDEEDFEKIYQSMTKTP